MVRQIRVLRYLTLCFLGLALVAGISFSLGAWTPSAVYAQAETTPEPTETPDAEAAEPEDAKAKPTGMRPFADVTKDLQRQDGLFTLYSDLNKGKAYLALQPEHLNRNFLLVATLESGVGEAGLFRGWPINDLLVQFREMADDRIQVVVPNTFIRNPEGQNWQQRLLENSFSDSVLFALKVVSIDPDSQAKLIDLSNLLIERDLANLTQALSWVISGYGRNADISRINQLQTFSQNLEVGTVLGFSGGGIPSDPLAALFGVSLQGLADNRGFTLGVRYSLSALPQGNGYRPRVADEQVGYFLTAFRTPIRAGQSDPFVRYINRWHLEKADPDAALSPPKEPIVFWVENTVPPAYREAIKVGTLLWNRAFEQAGFQDAIAVKQMPDNADWDPADVRYNVIRWSDSLRPWALGLGPSRVNPLTGEILDADIIIDANTVRLLQQQYQARGLEGSPEADFYLQLCGQRSQTWYAQWLTIQQFGEAGMALAQDLAPGAGQPSSSQLPDDHCTAYAGGQRTAFGALALSVLPDSSLDPSALDAYIQQYLVALTAHEVGHTLGLRHNFAGSRLLSPEVLNDPEVTRNQGMVSSVMDYFPPNIAPPGQPQGDYFPTRVGPYDIWAIEYGYRSVPPSPLHREERQLLQEITARGNAPELAYATDEDIFDFIDPEVNPWDLSDDPLRFAEWQLQNAQAVWQRLNRFSVQPGEGYGGLRRRVDLVFNYFRQNAYALTDYIGGQRFRRLDPWRDRTQNPLEPIAAAKQREALATLNQAVFAPDAFQFSPELLNQLPPDRWGHWGVALTRYPLDYPIYEQVLAVQSLALSDLMLANRLARVRDMEFKTDSEDVLTIAELFDSLYQSIWAEIANPEGTAMQVSSLRRGLQRHHLNILSNLVLRRNFWDALSAQSFTDFTGLVSTLGAPEDARVLARYQLRQLADDVETGLAKYGDKLDVITQAHLEDVRDRITRVLDAPLLGA
ncbi:MAG: zinc-dependent metalloprotease [Cyanobacteria bacterium J06638_28]